uniref:Chromo domain-containing protein n=1 Tax=Peronospora matthiolae TaxID=2874970 RepID=A0AAV1T3D0_9STRA
MDADVYGIDIDDDDDEDAGIFSITNDRQSEDDDTLTGDDNVLSAVHTKHTAVDKDESAEEFLLTREAAVRFVQDSVADALDGQKRNADKLNLPKHAVTNVGSSKLLPKYIGPFRVLRRMSNAGTIELPRKMRTHPTFYVCRLRPYYQYEPASRCGEHPRGRDPRPPSSGPVSTSQSGRLEKRPFRAVERCLDELQPSRREENESSVRSQVVQTQRRHNLSNDRARRNINYPSQDPQAHNTEIVHEPGHLATVPLDGSAPEHQLDPTLEPDQVFPLPPHPLVDSSGGKRFLVERILNHRDVNGIQASYLVRWRGYPLVSDIWEPRAQLIVDVLGLVEQYDETLPSRTRLPLYHRCLKNASVKNSSSARIVFVLESGGQIFLQSNNGMRSRSVVVPANRYNSLDGGIHGDST